MELNAQENLQNELESLKKELLKEKQKSNNLEAAFKRLLFATDTMMEVLNPIIDSFRGKTSIFKGATALPKIINQVMNLLTAEAAENIVKSADEDIKPLIVQYKSYYEKKDGQWKRGIRGLRRA